MNSSNCEICIQGPLDREVKFMYDPSFSSRVNAYQDGVILSQYGIDFFEILQTVDEQFYTIILEPLTPNSSQNVDLLTQWPLDQDSRLIVKFGTAAGPNRLANVSSNIFSLPERFRIDELKIKITREKFGPLVYRDEVVKFIHFDDNEPLQLVRVSNDEVIPFISYMEFVDNTNYSVVTPNRLTQDEFQAVSSSFAAKLTYSGKVQNTLVCEYICRCASLAGARASTIYAPYANLFQSSGFGKSRGVSEVGRRLSTIYGVFRKVEDASYPKQAPWLGSLYEFISQASEIDLPREGTFRISNYKVGRALLFFHCLVEAYIVWFKWLIQDDNLCATCFPEDAAAAIVLDSDQVLTLCSIYDYITNSFSAGRNLKRFNDTLTDLLRTKLMLDFSASDLYNSIVVEAAKFTQLNEYVFRRRNEMDRFEWARFLRTHRHASNDNPRICPNSDQGSYPFVVVLDEASVLSELTPGQVSVLTIIRRALHFIPPSNKFLVVSLGTNCDVTTLNKSITEDSLRFTNRPNLIYPMIVTGNWDIHATECELQNLVVDSKFVKNRQTMLLKASFGRPLWNSLNLNFMLSTALTKLKNGCTDPFTPMIAAWSIRVGLTVNASSKLAEKLLKSHMATLLATSSDADRVIVSYSAEPILAIAARSFLNQTDTSVIQYFQCLLKFVEGVPTDRGKIGESLFSEILLQAMDKSSQIDPATIISDRYPEGASERVLQILNTKAFLLEEPSTRPAPSADLFCRENFRACNVESFLETLYSVEVFSKIKPFLAAPLLKGTLNFAQFVSLHRNFPYERFFEGRTPSELSDASECDKKCDILDSAMMKLGLLKDIAYTCPYGYYGLDAFIPVLIEVDVEVEIRSRNSERVIGLLQPHINASTRSIGGRRIDVRKRSVQTYIGLQYKVGQADKIETLTKINPKLHMNTHGLDPWEIEAIQKYHLVLVLSSENDVETTELSTAHSPSVTAPFKVSHFSNPTLDTSTIIGNANRYDNLKKSFYSLPAATTLNLESMNIINSPKFPEGPDSPSSFTSVKVAQHVSVCGLSWDDNKKVACIWSSSLRAFRALLGNTVLDLTHEIMRSDRPVFTNQLDKFVIRSLADATLNTQTAFFPNSDPLLRSFRGHEKVKPVLENFNHWNFDLSVSQVQRRI